MYYIDKFIVSSKGKEKIIEMIKDEK